MVARRTTAWIGSLVLVAIVFGVGLVILILAYTDTVSRMPWNALGMAICAVAALGLGFVMFARAVDDDAHERFPEEQSEEHHEQHHETR